MKKIVAFIDGFVTIFAFVFLLAFAVIFPAMAAWRLAGWILG